MKKFRAMTLVLMLVLLATSAGAFAQDNKVTFMSTQWNTVEETDKVRTFLSAFEGGTVEFVPSEEGPLLDLIRAEAEAGEGTVDVIGALHGTYPTLAGEDLLFDLTDLLAGIEEQYDVNDAFVQLGKMGTEDVQYYIPFMQATFIMAATQESLQYLPEGADINNLTWDQFAAWAKAIYDATGEAKVGLPVAGLFHRFLQGYMFPSFTGGMVTGFKTPEAVAMFEYLNNLWPYIHPQSITYEFMQEPLLSGEVWVAFDHVARLKNAFDQQPDNFVAFPAPSGPAGRGFMSVVAGLAIPYTSPNPDGAEEFIKYMLSPETQATILSETGFYPVIGDVDMTSLPAGVSAMLGAVQAYGTVETDVPALLPVGLGDRGGEINEIFRNAFQRIVIDGEDIQTVLDEEGASLQTLLDETGAACWAPDPVSEGPCQLK
ncbi:MAG TPA: ABC transporter substrate-binding protein [Aggregatilineaceae bacterium]|nr:ABC transporter substrate-binding protein [Aggregatilineaceae bacterium]